jgi:hypothetical protein
MKENIKKNLLFTILVIAKYWIRAVTTQSFFVGAAKF